MSGPRIRREDSAGLCTLTLNRPDKLNALDTASFEELDTHCAALEMQTDTIGCVVLKGNGRSFCAGADLGALGTSPIDPRFKPSVIDRLARLPQPVIAAVHGACFTGGLELALAADFILADMTARFADTHGKFGLVGAWGMGQRLSRRIGIPAAKRMMMTARTILAEEASDIGLIDCMAEESELGDLIKNFAAEILVNSWHTNFAAKRMMRETEGMSLSAALTYEQDHYPGYASDYQDRINLFTRK